MLGAVGAHALTTPSAMGPPLILTHAYCFEFKVAKLATFKILLLDILTSEVLREMRHIEVAERVYRLDDRHILRNARLEGVTATSRCIDHVAVVLRAGVREIRRWRRHESCAHAIF